MVCLRYSIQNFVKGHFDKQIKKVKKIGQFAQKC